MSLKSSRADGLLTYSDLAEQTGHHVKTIKGWASAKRPIARRLKVIRLTHKTVLVRPAAWERFISSAETQNTY